MRSHARSIHLAVCAVLLVSATASPLFAQTDPSQAPPTPTTVASFTKPGPPPNPAGGICAPWHRCIAWAGLGMAVLLGLALAAGYMVQSKGFEQIEHKQGNPEGVKASRE